MPATKRDKTRYPGVYYVIGKAVGTGKRERIYYIRYRKNGKQVEEKAGRQFQDDMTPARAANLRSERIGGKVLSNSERRAEEEALKAAEAGRWTIDRLWGEYRAQRKPGKGLTVDANRYKLHLKASFGGKEPHELVKLDVDRLRIKLLRKKSPQTVAHVLNLLTWIINFGVSSGLCKGLYFKIKKPTVDNIKTEDLNPDQLKALLDAIDADSNQDVANMMRLALYSGMRRNEMFNLKWSDVDFNRGFVTLRHPKGGKDQAIPMNEAARNVLSTHGRTRSPFVFPGKNGRKRVTAAEPSQRIRERAGLPKDFRPFHGLRHVYASMLASSGKVDMYTLQKLLTHKSPLMTQRYAHLRDEALRRASDLAGDMITRAMNGAGAENKKVVNLDDHRK